MNQVYVLMGQEDEWESEPFCAGVFSTKEKAEAILPKANKIFPNHNFWIEPTIVDDFSWKQRSKEAVKR